MNIGHCIKTKYHGRNAIGAPHIRAWCDYGDVQYLGKSKLENTLPEHVEAVRKLIELLGKDPDAHPVHVGTLEKEYTFIVYGLLDK